MQLKHFKPTQAGNALENTNQWLKANSDKYLIKVIDTDKNSQGHLTPEKGLIIAYKPKKNDYSDKVISLLKQLLQASKLSGKSLENIDYQTDL